MGRLMTLGYWRLTPSSICQIQPFNFIKPMKKIVLIAICVMASVCAMAQTTESASTNAPYKREGDTFVQTKTGAKLPYKGDQVTAYRWKDSKGNEYPIILHTYTKGDKKGEVGAYVIRTSAKTGNQYPYWLPKELTEEILKENE